MKTAFGSLLLSTSAISSALAWKDQCVGFKAHSVDNIRNITSLYYAAGSLVNLTSLYTPLSTSSLPAFCRVQFTVVTNPATDKTAQAELWLPDGWNKRVIGYGNGGWSGGLPYTGIGPDGVAQGYASYGTDTGQYKGKSPQSAAHASSFLSGHQSSSRNGSWGLGNDDAIVDHAYRALHLTTVASKFLTMEYYGQNYTKSYYSGCSTGGRQGLKAMTMFPEDYDGVVIGSPANSFGRLMPWELHQSLVMQPVNSSRWIPAATWTAINKEVLKQCDGIDGVVDGILSDPEACKYVHFPRHHGPNANFVPERMTCKMGYKGTDCLTLDQLETFQKLYTTYIDSEQNYVFSPYALGGELGYGSGLSTAIPFPIAEDYYKYFVLNDTKWDWRTINASTIALGMKVNPGNMDVTTPDLTAFFARGGKVIQYVGWQDPLITPGNSIKWYKDVVAYTAAKSDLDVDNHFKLFTVPGMQHCRGGPGAWIFGANAQRAQAPPLQEGPQYDVQAAMVEWLEQERSVDHIVSVKYTNDTLAQGVAFTRKLCPFEN
ncbi:hypothetical protein QFC21_002275 [Naganishia friedmannii]|uniref:Uncharacterized protein n=1 Tax=Naganishia friedmannii TaxID=89922 RepID=A0ACC2VXB1_9TREE|nr:hypothetical protein QFC21_002275 [Naganishia friedmannii]